MNPSRMKVRLVQHLDRFLSSPTGGWMSADEARSPRDWAVQQRGTVRFDDSLRVAAGAGGRLFVEAGPAGPPSGPGHTRFGSPDSAIATSLLRQSGGFEAEGLLEALGRVWASEVDIDFDALDTPSGARGVPRPTHPCDRRES